MFSRYFKGLLFLFLTLFLISFSFGACLEHPTYIKVKSGTNLVGNFDYSSLNAGDLIYIKGSLHEYPLSLDFYFEGQDSNCFSSEDDVQVRLFSSGILISANSISTSGNATVASFVFDIDTNVTNSFTSNYIVKTIENPSGTEDVIRFGIDDIAPQFTTFSSSPSNILILPNTSISIDYTIFDDQSKLNYLKITGGITSIVNFDGKNSTYSNSISSVLTSSKTYFFSALDMLGNSANKNITYVVDGSGPVFSNFNVESYTRNEYGTRKVTFSLQVEDTSYGVIDTLPIVYGDFTSINSVDSSLQADCLRVDGESSTYECVFADVDITLLNETTSESFTFSSVDTLGNSNSQDFTKEIFYDSAGPEITDFYLINGNGDKDIFNALDENAKIVVKFTDDSVENKNDLRLYPNFDGIETYLIPNCDNVTNNQGSCFWDLGNTLKKYSGIETGNVTFSLTLIDVYGNPTTQNLVLRINNEKPQITDIQLIETTDIKDSIVNSGEKINFRIFIKDDNLVFDDDYIYADFSSIDFDDGMNHTSASCAYYNESLIQCDYTGIVVENGYLKRNVSFIVTDTAGNRVIEEYPVEVFAIGNEVFSSFKISNIVITNALDKYVIRNSGADAWFEGNIELADGNPDIKIVNYQLKSCNDSDMNPVLLGDRRLYPSEVVVSDYGETEADHNFVLKVEVETHPNAVDLETNQMKCTMSVLKRDNETIYPAELVDFNVQFEYYYLPYEDLLSANAANILSMIDDAEGLGSWFDSLYSVYDIFDTLCSVVTNGNGIISSVGQAWYSVSLVLHVYPPTDAMATSGDNGIFGMQGTMSSLRNGLSGFFEDDEGSTTGSIYGYVKKVCDWVTCSNGKGGIFFDENGFGADSSSMWETYTPEFVDIIKNAQTGFGVSGMLANQCTDEDIVDVNNVPSENTGTDSKVPSTPSEDPSN